MVVASWPNTSAGVFQGGADGALALVLLAANQLTPCVGRVEVRHAIRQHLSLLSR